MDTGAWQQEFDAFLKRYAYMDAPECLRNDYWKGWGARHEAIAQMIRSCFRPVGDSVNMEKMRWIVETKLSCKDVESLLVSCFQSFMRDNEQVLRTDESRFTAAVKLLVSA